MRIDKKTLSRTYKRVLLVLTIVLIVVFFITMGYPWYLAERSFMRSSYKYKIDEIKFESGHRGLPSVRIDSVWNLLKAGELKVVPYIKVGDSLVKQSGTKKIILFRRDSTNKLVTYIFD